jgi:hypothetical protein
MKLNSNLKQKFWRTVIGGALIAGLLPATNAFAVSTLPTSGSCAMLVTQPVPVGVDVTGGPVTASYNTLAIITFTSATTATIDFHGTSVDYSAGGYTVSATHEGDSALPVAITALGGGAPASVKSLTFTPTGSGVAVVANAVAVNGGNTILIQGESDAFSGVCQF